MDTWKERAWLNGYHLHLVCQPRCRWCFVFRRVCVCACVCVSRVRWLMSLLTAAAAAAGRSRRKHVACSSQNHRIWTGHKVKMWQNFSELLLKSLLKGAVHPKHLNPVIYSPSRWREVRWSFVIHKTFLELRSKTDLIWKDLNLDQNRWAKTRSDPAADCGGEAGQVQWFWCKKGQQRSAQVRDTAETNRNWERKRANILSRKS